MSSSEIQPDELERVLIDCARQRKDISYSEAIAALGLRFTRPRMRTLCRVLGELDERNQGTGEPSLAVLVVRASDRLPGEGWWLSRKSYRGDYQGDQAKKYVRKLQNQVFQYWQSK